MRLIVWAEWLRFRRSRANMAILAAYSVILALSAIWATLGAQQHRQDQVRQAAASDALIQQAQHAAAKPGATPDHKSAAMQAFTLGRSMAGLAQLPTAPGLALSLSRYDTLNTRVAVSVESRHADGRRSDALSNPALGQYGAFDLAVVVTLLLPLVAIGWCAGTVQEDREQGVWRAVCAQAARPWMAFHAALAIRATALILPPALACGLSMALDAGAAAWPAMVWWTLCLAAYAIFWIALCGLLARFPVSSAAALLIALTTWLLLTYAVPASLESLAAARHPMPSRLASIVDLRRAQQNAEVRMPELLAGWYGRHPESAPLISHGHTWPVTFLPRFEHQDQQLRPLMRSFDQQRLAQGAFLERWIWLAPPVALLGMADHLAGISVARHAAFMDDVDRYEQEWREFFVPRVMSYRGLSEDDFSRIPRFQTAEPTTPDAAWLLLRNLLLVDIALIVLLLAGTRQKL
ncbi:hypothetical protein ASE30_13770 [Achromobacter sp. Root83]|uniref:DUF3526 domain-containing protein n=1 Tax=Achromobacter sp. Root83 TaxID=1736602 RepID=UPI00070EAC2E|nr:DUF3526 domain-containing protein [Achromobacter sp. Root83]KRC71820.1 hypothetical protein ASE30_13770 [Achromobacter sp. Root83]